MTFLSSVFPANIDQQLAHIKRNIYLRKNGVVSESIESKGIRYAKNYGVSMPDLKQMSQIFPHEATLAQRLWEERIRETMLLATILYPSEMMDLSKARLWMKDINNIELAEQAARNLFSKAPDAEAMIAAWIQSDDSWQQSTALITAAYCIEHLSSDTLSVIDEQTLVVTKDTTYEIYWAVALYLKKRGGINRESAQRILRQIGKFKDSSHLSERYIFEEVSTILCYQFDL